MYLTLIVLPLLGSIVSGFFGRNIGVTGSHVITCTCVISTTILAIVSFFEVGICNVPVYIKLFRWIDSESLNVSWGFAFDSLTVSMLIPVLIVSSLVHIYSIGYMSHDPHNQRFFSYLSLFTFMMIILVTADNFLLMFVGWEGVGVCSYLLVSFWFTRIAANQSSLSAFLTNRVGDCFLTIGMFAILWSFGNLNYSTVFSVAPLMSNSVVTLIGICLLIGAMAKSSQIGLHVWLPMAMEGPTPVSALIHAATMVTAGVYLLMRTSPLIEYSNTVLLLCLWVGAITTVFSSLIGLFQQDIKKVIAYSTMSQLGMMVIAIGLSSYNIALFHLVNHAFYKALLFLGAGAVIHAVSDNQDFRKYGGLISFLPLTYSVMLIASLSLVAFPFMTGFYSKDFILESAYGHATEDLGWLDSPSALNASVERLKTVKALGLDAGVDFHGRVHKAMAIQLAHKLAPHEPLFIEEPLLSEHPESVAALSKLIPIPIALGERLHSRWDFKPFLESASVSILQPDISHVGGISELRRIAIMGEAYDTALAPHCPLGPISLAANIQVDAVSANFAIQEMSVGIHYNHGSADIGTYIKNPEVWDVKDGMLNLMRGPGLGIQIDEDKVRAAAVGAKAWRSPCFEGPGGEWREW